MIGRSILGLQRGLMPKAIVLVLLTTGLLAAQQAAAPKEYAGEFEYSCGHVMQLAEATPEDKLAWRPAPGIRSFGEVYMHIAGGNLMLLGLAGVKQPGGLEKAPDVPTIQKWEREITSKRDILAWLQRGCDAVPSAWRAETVKSLDRAVDFFGKPRTVYGFYLRMIVHLNEHMGQLVAYARMNGIRPPWAGE